MQFKFGGAAVQLVVLWLALADICLSVPVQDSPRQRYLNELPSNHQKHPPFTRKHKDQHDHKVDSVGKGLHPLPFRNGDGATVLGPRNPAREQQNPDMVRPPTTDHGDMKNMRWSFADSHTRIEVSQQVLLNTSSTNAFLLP